MADLPHFPALSGGFVFHRVFFFLVLFQCLSLLSCLPGPLFPAQSLNGRGDRRASFSRRGSEECFPAMCLRQSSWLETWYPGLLSSAVGRGSTQADFLFPHSFAPPYKEPSRSPGQTNYRVGPRLCSPSLAFRSAHHIPLVVALHGRGLLPLSVVLPAPLEFGLVALLFWLPAARYFCRH